MHLSLPTNCNCVDVPRPSPLHGESLVRVTLAGICNTDIEITKGYADFHGIIGHEFVGIAEGGPLAGQRVVGEINVSCGRCAMCRSNNRSHCLQRKVVGIRQRDGVMAEYVALPDEKSTRGARFGSRPPGLSLSSRWQPRLKSWRARTFARVRPSWSLAMVSLVNWSRKY